MSFDPSGDAGAAGVPKDERLLGDVLDALALPAAVLIWRRDGSLVRANARASALTGRPVRVGASVAEIAATHRLLYAGSERAFPASALVPLPRVPQGRDGGEARRASVAREPAAAVPGV